MGYGAGRRTEIYAGVVAVNAGAKRPNSKLTRRCTRPPTASALLCSFLAPRRLRFRRRVSLVVVPPRLHDTNRVWSTPVAGTCPPSMRVLASAFVWLIRFCSGAAFWAFVRAALLLGCGFWASAAEMFRLWRGASVSAAAAIPAFQLRHNKSLHPTVTAPFVPHFAYTAGEFRRCAAALA